MGVKREETHPDNEVKRHDLKEIKLKDFLYFHDYISDTHCEYFAGFFPT